MNTPSIFHYTDYRKFLRDWCDHQKNTKKDFTYRSLAADVGFKSAGHLSMILRRNANLSPAFARKIAAVMKLKKKETGYFLTMAAFNQARKHSEKIDQFNKLTSFRQSSIHLVHKSQYAFYDKWYHSAIRVLIEFFPFRDDYEALAGMLIPPVTPGQAKKSIALQEKLQLIYRDTDGLYHPVDKIISTGYEIHSIAVTNFVLETARLALEAADRFKREERNLSALTVGLSRSGFSRVEHEIREFRKKILSITREEHAEAVYQVGVQLFPVSKMYRSSSEDNES